MNTNSYVSYIRWGKKTCPTDADVIYTGTDNS